MSNQEKSIPLSISVLRPLEERILELDLPTTERRSILRQLHRAEVWIGAAPPSERQFIDDLDELSVKVHEWMPRLEQLGSIVNVAVRDHFVALCRFVASMKSSKESAEARTAASEAILFLVRSVVRRRAADQSDVEWVELAKNRVWSREGVGSVRGIPSTIDDVLEQIAAQHFDELS